MNVIRLPRISDHNPIVNIWEIISRDVYAGENQFSSIDYLKFHITESLDYLDPVHLHYLISSMVNQVFK